MYRIRFVKFAPVVSAAFFLAAYLPLPGLAQQAPGTLAIPADDSAVDGDSQGDATVKGGVGLRSLGGQLGHTLQMAIQSGTVPVQGSPIGGQSGPGNGKNGGDVDSNKQVNNPAFDHVVTFSGTRPFEFSTESETSVTANGQHIVVGYNSSAGAVVQRFPSGLFFTQLFFSAYSVSHDGGLTWASGFVPPVAPSSPFTFGDPALALDRDGNVFYASLGTDAKGNSAVIINKSIDNGNTFAAARVVAIDP